MPIIHVCDICGTHIEAKYPMDWMGISRFEINGAGEIICYDCCSKAATEINKRGIIENIQNPSHDNGITMTARIFFQKVGNTMLRPFVRYNNTVGFELPLAEMEAILKMCTNYYSANEDERYKAENPNAGIGYVYMAVGKVGEYKGAYKIGHSINPKNRIKSFGSEYNTKAELIATIEVYDPRRVEKAWHNHFREFACKPFSTNEWFNLQPEHVNQFIASQDKGKAQRGALWRL
jgi:hypothetical protein